MAANGAVALEGYDRKEPELMQERSSSGSETDDGNVSQEKAGTAFDQRDMSRVGKTQELRRNFRFISVLGFTAVLMCTWEAVLFTASYILPNGGYAGLVWMYVVAVFGFGLAILSMAEMASMAPTAGGQYHWVSEFSPKSAQKLLSYITGWLCVLGWQVNIGSGSYLVGLQIQGLIILNDDSYVPKQWHGTLFVIAVATVAIVFNTFFARKLPLIEGIMLLLHVVGFFAILIPLWVFAPHVPASTVFGEFSYETGWSSTGTACLVGIIGPLYSLLGPDSAVHMAEEIRDASLVLPRAMMWTLVVNGITGFVSVITFAFSISDLETALMPTYNFAYIDVFYARTGSKAGATVMTCIIITLTLCSTISNVATASRQMFAFARDRGLPFASTLSYVRPGWDIPLNAIFVSFIITCLLSLINLGSYVAFNAILSLSVSALLTSYSISIGCVALKRLRGQDLHARRWSLGKLGLPINIAAVCFLLLCYVFTFFPLSEAGLSPQTMNWSIVMYGGVVILASVYYIIYARHYYTGPVLQVKDIRQLE